MVMKQQSVPGMPRAIKEIRRLFHYDLMNKISLFGDGRTGYTRTDGQTDEDVRTYLKSRVEGEENL